MQSQAAGSCFLIHPIFSSDRRQSRARPDVTARLPRRGPQAPGGAGRPRTRALADHTRRLRWPGTDHGTADRSRCDALARATSRPGDSSPHGAAPRPLVRGCARARGLPGSRVPRLLAGAEGPGDRVVGASLRGGDPEHSPHSTVDAGDGRAARPAAGRCAATRAPLAARAPHGSPHRLGGRRHRDCDPARRSPDLPRPPTVCSSEQVDPARLLGPERQSADVSRARALSTPRRPRAAGGDPEESGASPARTARRAASLATA
jgi:hypothetical protein